MYYLEINVCACVCLLLIENNTRGRILIKLGTIMYLHLGLVINYFWSLKCHTRFSYISVNTRGVLHNSLFLIILLDPEFGICHPRPTKHLMWNLQQLNITTWLLLTYLNPKFSILFLFLIWEILNFLYYLGINQ